MINVVLTNLNTETTVSLNSGQISAILREIKATSGPWFMRLLWWLFPSIWRNKTMGLLELTAPDAEITVTENNRVRKYQIFARTILVDVVTGRPRQFYMGLLVLEWLGA